MTRGFRWTTCGRKNCSDELCRKPLCSVSRRHTNLSVTGDGDHAEGDLRNAERHWATEAGKRVHETGDRARKAWHGEQSQVLVRRERTRPLHLIHAGASFHSALPFPAGSAATHRFAAFDLGSQHAAWATRCLPCVTGAARDGGGRLPRRRHRSGLGARASAAVTVRLASATREGLGCRCRHRVACRRRSSCATGGCRR